MKINSDAIKLLIAKKNISLSTFADEINISRQWLGVVLSRGYASPQIVNKLAKGLNVDVSEILLKE